jgi:hypothetical protein
LGRSTVAEAVEHGNGIVAADHHLAVNEARPAGQCLDRGSDRWVTGRPIKPRRLNSRTPAASRRANSRKPFSLISCTQQSRDRLRIPREQRKLLARFRTLVSGGQAGG